MKKYELLYIIPSPYTETEAPSIQQNIDKIIEENGGKIINEENLGNKKLAYPIKQIRRGFYILVIIEALPETILQITQKLKLTNEVLRFQITDYIEYTKKAKPKRARPVAKKIETSNTSSSTKTSFADLDNQIDELLEI